MRSIVEVIGAAISGAIAAWGAIAVNNRRTSGRIDTSEAAQLWEESRNIRVEQNQRIADQAKRMDAQDHRIEAQDRRIAELEEANRRCEERLEAALRKT